MVNDVSPPPIEPEPSSRSAGHTDPLLVEIARLGPVRRVLVATILVIVATVLALAALVLSGVNHWVAAVVILLVLERLAVFCAFGALYCIVPTSAVGRWFHALLCWAKPVLLFVLIGFAATSLGGLAWAAWVLYWR